MPALIVIMVEPGFDETVGLIARVMKNFGLKNLRLVNPVAKLGRRAKMKAVHAQEILQESTTYHSLQEALIGVDLTVGTTAQKARSQYRVLRRPATPKELAEQLGKVQGTIGLVFGREGTGLTNKELDMCDTIATIPSSPEYPTLNISHAAAILFYELYEVSKMVPEDILAPPATRDTILRFLETSATFARTNPDETKLAIRAFKNVLGRSAIRIREASLLAGILRNITINLEQTSRPEPSLKPLPIQSSQ